MTTSVQNLVRLGELVSRCPLCGRIPRTAPYSTVRKREPAPVILDRKLAGQIAASVRKNSENKDGVLIENNPGGSCLTKAFQKAGYSRLIVTDSGNKNRGSIKAEQEGAEVVRGNIFSVRNMTTLQSEVEDSIAMTLPQRFWPDDPVATVFGTLPSTSRDNNLLLYFIRKLSLITGLYSAGRVEWFLFVSPSKARTLLCGSGEGPKAFYYPSGAVVNALYDIKLCMSVKPDDFTPSFNTGRFQKEVQVCDRLLTKETVPLLKLVPRRDLYVNIPSQEIWPFFNFLRQIVRKRDERIIPLMEKFVHGCGLRMIDMGYTMIDEVWQVKPKQFLDLYINTISWPEYDGSVLKSHLTGVTDIADDNRGVSEDHEHLEIVDEHIDPAVVEDHIDMNIS